MTAVTGFAGETPTRHGTQFVFAYRWDQVGEGISHYTCTTCAADIIVIHRINGDVTLTVHGRWHATPGKTSGEHP